MLVVEVEYLTGVARAANDRGDAADWPPQPDRLFSALTASWAARGEAPQERAALEWLEAQDPPRLDHSDAHPRSVAPVFVPPNDDSSGAISIMPNRRRRQERRFPAARPTDPCVRFAWAAEPDAATLDALDALARDTSYLGHSASVVRCRAYRETEAPAETRAARRRVYPGRLDELVGCYTGHGDKTRQVRPSPGADVRAPAESGEVPPASVFGADWIVFAHADEPRPDAVAGAMACKALLKTVLSGYGSDPVPAWVSGHAPDGAPLTTPHLAAVPLLDAGWEQSRGRLMGLALIPPRAVTEAVARARDPHAETVARADVAVLDQVTALERALARMVEADRLALRLPGGLVWPLQWDTEAKKQSLRPALYTETAATWATVTPLALDRHPKKDGDIEAAIADACERIGLPRPSVVVAHKHSAHRAAPSAKASGTAPPWTGWRRPESVAGRRLTHAVLRFPHKVAGPVILGAGRFVGLGLCRPLPEPKEART
jgi:CRISPR-associated protein Csb2